MLWRHPCILKVLRERPGRPLPHRDQDMSAGCALTLLTCHAVTACYTIDRLNQPGRILTVILDT